MEQGKINIDFVEVFKNRTKTQAVSILKHLRTIKFNDEIQVIKHQLIKSSTSVAANYRAACRAKSNADFISKLGIVNEEADETVFWMEILQDLDYNSEQLQNLKKESEEILKIVAKSLSTSRNNLKISKSITQNSTNQ